MTVRVVTLTPPATGALTLWGWDPDRSPGARPSGCWPALPPQRRWRAARRGRRRPGSGRATGSPIRSSAPAARPSAADWRSLAGRLHGTLVRRGTAGYDQARLLFDRRFDGEHPAAVVRVATTGDVATGLAFAHRFALPLHLRSGGHSYLGASSGPGLVLDLRALNGVRVDAGAGTATLGAGIALVDAYDGLAAQGVAIPAGSCPTRRAVGPDPRRRDRGRHPSVRPDQRPARRGDRRDRSRRDHHGGRRPSLRPALGAARRRRQLRRRHVAAAADAPDARAGPRLPGLALVGGRRRARRLAAAGSPGTPVDVVDVPPAGADDPPGAADRRGGRGVRRQHGRARRAGRPADTGGPDPADHELRGVRELPRHDVAGGRLLQHFRDGLPRGGRDTGRNAAARCFRRRVGLLHPADRVGWHRPAGPGRRDPGGRQSARCRRRVVRRPRWCRRRRGRGRVGVRASGCAVRRAVHRVVGHDTGQRPVAPQPGVTGLDPSSRNGISRPGSRTRTTRTGHCAIRSRRTTAPTCSGWSRYDGPTTPPVFSASRRVSR